LKLYEYESKNILSKYSIATPKGATATNSNQAKETAEKLKLPVAVKAQVLVAGRGKAGGVLFANSTQEAKDVAQKLLKTQIKGIPVKKVLIEEKISIDRELYFGIVLDRINRCYVAVASQVGGMDIEELADQSPEKILRTRIKPQLGFRAFHARQIAKKMGYIGPPMLELSELIEKIYQAGMDNDAELAEVNPIVETAEGKFLAADARIIIDDNALFRHPEYKKKQLEEQRDHTPLEFKALKNDLDYVELDGDIGVVGNGAGLVMATMDMINAYGGKPANFLDLGGGATTEKIAAALGIVLSNPQVKVAFVNILGGMTHCDDVAGAILEVKQKTRTQKPIVVRLVGTNEQEGKRILKGAAMLVFESIEEAAQKAVEFSKQEVKL
jgi:succinyl-CoA synthetase beta subunit